MAGDWIKIQSVTPDKPEVAMLAAVLEIDEDAVVGKLLRFWIWADRQSISGNALGVTKAFIDERIAFQKGFTDALVQVGWLFDDDGKFTVPNFERHNGQTAKSRAQGQKRSAKKRNAECVTEASPEKRKEEKKKSKPKETFKPPTTKEVQDYADQYLVAHPDWNGGNRFDAERWHDHYTANGWKVGKAPMKNWQAAVRNWGKRSPFDNQTQEVETERYYDVDDSKGHDK